MTKYTIEKAPFKSTIYDELNKPTLKSYKIIVRKRNSSYSENRHRRKTLFDAARTLEKNDHNRDAHYFITKTYQINVKSKNYTLLIDDDFSKEEVNDMKKIFINYIDLQGENNVTLNEENYIWVNDT